MNKNAGTAKTLLHEMDLKVAELVPSDAAKHSVERDDALLPADALLTRQQNVASSKPKMLPRCPRGERGTNDFGSVSGNVFCKSFILLKISLSLSPTRLLAAFRPPNRESLPDHCQNQSASLTYFTRFVFLPSFASESFEASSIMPSATIAL